MTTQRNVVYPSPCSCIVAYEWDDKNIGNITLKQIIKIGSEHSGLSGLTLLNTLGEESGRIQTVLSYVLNNFAYMRQQFNEEGNNPAYMLVDDASYVWKYEGVDAARILKVQFSPKDLNTNDKTTLQTAMDQQLGSAKVLVL